MVLIALVKICVWTRILRYASFQTACADPSIFVSIKLCSCVKLLAINKP